MNEVMIETIRIMGIGMGTVFLVLMLFYLAVRDYRCFSPVTNKGFSIDLNTYCIRSIFMGKSINLEQTYTSDDVGTIDIIWLVVKNHMLSNTNIW